jgi:hypothetical protein
MCLSPAQPLALTPSTNPTPSTACRSRLLLLLVLACAKYPFAGNQTITGTLTAAGASAVRRIMLRSSAVGTTRTLTVGTLSADDCDFRDITIAGTAAGGSPTRAGDCGGNSGVTFPAPKTVYWNLAGTQGWSATAWATTSGGTPALNNFPLAQDTAVFDDTGSAGTVQLQTFNIGTIDASARHVRTYAKLQCGIFYLRKLDPWFWHNSQAEMVTPFQVAELKLLPPLVNKFLALSPSTAAQAPCSLLMRWSLPLLGP